MLEETNIFKTKSDTSPFHAFDKYPPCMRVSQAKRAKLPYPVCRNNIDEEICTSILNYRSRSKRKPKLLNTDERELLEKMEIELRTSSRGGKKEIQQVIDFIVECGRDRFIMYKKLLSRKNSMNHVRK